MQRLSLVLCIVALTAVACGDPASVLPTTPGAPGVTGIELSGPSSIAPGQSVQLVVSIRLADGTSKLPSAGTPLQWFTSNNSVLRVSSTGIATAGEQVGSAFVTVLHGTGNSSRQANREFVVVPNGTYRVVGTVTESDFPTVPISNARLTVSPGSLTTVTNFDGGYTLFGVPANAVVTVAKAGYADLSQSMQLTTHSTQDFRLTLIGLRLNLAGNYTLTIDVSGSCSSVRPLSAALQRRTYDAVVAQNGSELAVTLPENRFRTNTLGRGKGFRGRSDPSGAVFILDTFYHYYYPYYGPAAYPNVAERLADNTILVLEGIAAATGSGAGLSGTMQLVMYHYDSRFPAQNSALLAFCGSSAAQFTLTPR